MYALLRLLGRGRSGHLVSGRFLDHRELSSILRHLEFEGVFGLGYFLDGDTHTHLGVAHLGIGGPVPSVAVHRAFRIDGVACAGERAVGVNLLVRVISQERDALTWTHRPCALRVARDKEPARIPFALFRGGELASGHRAERLGLADDVPRADVIGKPLELWPWLWRALRSLRLDGYDEKHHANREQYSYSFHNHLRLNLPHSGCRSQGKSRSRRCVACEDDTSLIQIFNRESFSLRGLFVGHRVRRRIVCVLFDCDMRLEDWSTFIATKRYEVPSAGSQLLINALTVHVDFKFPIMRLIRTCQIISSRMVKSAGKLIVPVKRFTSMFA